jgi:hypothetical protein
MISPANHWPSLAMTVAAVGATAKRRGVMGLWWAAGRQR